MEFFPYVVIYTGKSLLYSHYSITSINEMWYVSGIHGLQIEYFKSQEVEALRPLFKVKKQIITFLFLFSFVMFCIAGNSGKYFINSEFHLSFGLFNLSLDESLELAIILRFLKRLWTTIKYEMRIYWHY